MQKYTGSIRCFLVLLILTAINMACISPVFASETPVKTIRIGYYSGSTDFQDGFSDDERKSGYAYEYYQKLATMTGWRYEYVYGSRSEILDKLQTGEVDLAAGIHQSEKSTIQALYPKYDMGLIGDELYFAVNIDREDLLNELNLALDWLSASSPNFTMTLWQKYYSQDSQQQELTTSEQEWLSEIGSISIGYVRGNLPLSDQSADGTPVGVISELLDSLLSYLNTPINPVCYDTIALMEEGLRNGEIDVAFPIYSDLWLSETKDFLQTDAFVNDRVMIVYKGSYQSDLLDKIALSEMGVGQRYYLSAYYPDSETVYFDTREDSFQAIESGEVNCLVDCSSILQNFLSKHSEYQDINMAYLDTSEYFGMGVNHGQYRLIGILNKAISQFDDATITSAMIKYSNVEKPYTFMDFLQHYAVAVMIVLGIFFAIVLWLFLNFRRKTNAYNKEQTKTRAALEDALSAANAASKAKTTFLSSMSHDIRTPMNGIIGMTAIAAAHLDDTPRVKDCLTKITSSGKHLLALINEVLDMSKIESGELSLNDEIVELASLMDDLITLNHPLADAKRQELIVHTLNISHEEVIGDSLRLQQVFTNLVSNAIKYTPEGGKIEITLSEKPSKSPKIGCFQFIVEDNGIGMSEEYLPHLFEAFTRANNTTTSQIQGTGLGMTITHNIVQMLNGDIQVESTYGEGSKFTVTLYLKLRESENIHYEDFVDLDVLVVDDDQVICDSACIILSEIGMRGEWATSGKEAIRKVEERHKNDDDYFAVLVDWKMPEMDGLTTTMEIRKRIGPDVPIIITSAYDWSVVKEEATEAGANAFIGKPLFKSRLVHLFNQLLDNKVEETFSGLQELTAHTDFSGKRAILAEDNDINAEIAMEILGMTGLVMDWAHNGKEAVSLMEASAPGHYDCIFMDVQMPVMNGIEATMAIRKLEHPDAKEIPIFAMTANAFAEDIQAVLNAGMNEHIAKPLNVDELLKILNAYFS